MKKLILIASILITSKIVVGQPGALDNSFGVGGHISFGDATTFALAHDIVVQPDGKIVTAGYQFGQAFSFADISRFDANGTWDFTFNAAQYVYYSLQTIALQPDGKILFGGSDPNGSFLVLRLNNDGSADSTFDGDGMAITVLNTTNSSIITGIAVQADGKIVACGQLGYDSLVLFRYKSDGSLDSTYDNDGIVTGVVLPAQNQYPYSIALQSDGKTVIAGTSYGPTDNDFVVLRFDTTGSLDLSFDGDGMTYTNFSGEDIAYGLAIQPDGKIVVAGQGNGGNNDFIIARYLSNGTLDAAFDGDGKVTTDFGNNSFDGATDVGIQSDGRIVVTGSSSTSSSIGVDFAVVRYMPNGALDLGFDSDGKVTTDLNYDESGASMDIQPDGKIVVFGRWNFGVSVMHSDFLLARYLVDCIPFSIATGPSSDSVCSAELKKFSVVANGNVSVYQWQEDQGSGFVNLNNSGIYSNVNADTLCINGVTLGMNGYQYRCILLDACNATDTTSLATLSVNACVGIREDTKEVLLNIFPNPLTEQGRVNFSAELLDAELIFYNNLGQIVSTMVHVSGSSTTICREAFVSGMYQLIIVQDGVQIGSGQMIIGE